MSSGNQKDPIEHVVVLMLENRSFDQMLGDVPGVDGVAPHNVNLLNGVKYRQSPNARKVIPKFDPKHLYPNVINQLKKGGGQFVKDYWCEYDNPLTLRFWEHRWRLQFWEHPRYEDIMDYFSVTSNRLSALHTLATNFTTCDNWYSSVPGPTWPNRFFVHSGTSRGYVCLGFAEQCQAPFPLQSMHSVT